MSKTYVEQFCHFSLYLTDIAVGLQSFI